MPGLLYIPAATPSKLGRSKRHAVCLRTGPLSRHQPTTIYPMWGDIPARNSI